MVRVSALSLSLALAMGCSNAPVSVDAGATAALCIARGLCVSNGPGGASGFNGLDSCWDGCNWCRCNAAGELYVCTGQACDAGPSTRDGGADAAPSRDSGTDGAITNDDAGLDCATIGCGAPPICGTACDAPCGCCPCAEGSEMGTYVCEGGCWAPRGTGASGDACAVTSDCGGGLSCCYPCGIPGCTNRCTPTCAPGDPGCFGGCLALP